MGIKERKEREKEKRRQSIMTAARKILKKNGFDKATMESIANEAELSPGTIYLYFKSKNDLYASLSIRILKFLNEKLHELKKNNDINAEQKILSLKDIMHELFTFDPIVVIHMFNFQSNQTINSFSSEISSEILEQSINSQKIISDFFKDGTKQGIIIDKDPDSMAGLVWAVFSGVVLKEESTRRIKGDTKLDIQATLDDAFDIFFRGIKS